MTDVVTSTAALQQPNLYAPRQQVFVVERAGNAPDDAPAPDPNTRNAFHHPTQSAIETRRDEARAVEHDGPSRARIEIRSLDIGLTPAEVVGTPDVLQRFDENGDGRVDLVEADKATLSRQQKVTTFAGLAGSAPERRDDVAGGRPAAAAQAKKIIVTTAPDGTGDGSVPPKIAGEAATAGTPSGSVDVPKRFYGEGVEIAVGPAVANGGEATVKLSEKRATTPQVAVSEDGTSEVKLYDKVAQSEQSDSHAGNGGNGEAPLHDKARQAAVAVNGGKKVVLVEVSAYTNTAAITAPTVAEPKVVTA